MAETNCEIDCNLELPEVEGVCPTGETQAVAPDPTGDITDSQAVSQDVNYSTAENTEDPGAVSTATIAVSVETGDSFLTDCSSDSAVQTDTEALAIAPTGVEQQVLPEDVTQSSCPAEVPLAEYDDSGITAPIVPTIDFSTDTPIVEDVTTESVDGTGVFDVYMRAGMNQLNTQWEKGRIKGADYAATYVAQMQLMMTEANKFVLGVAQVEVAIMQAQIAKELFTQQYTAAYYDTLAKKASIGQLVAQGTLTLQQVEEVRQQTYKIKADAAMTCQQNAQLKEATIKTKAETKMVAQQEAQLKEATIKTKVDRTMVSQQMAELKANGVNERAMTKQKILESKEGTAKIKEEVKLVCIQVAGMKENNVKTKTDRNMITQQIAELKLNGKIERSLKQQQTEATRQGISKIKAEGKLLAYQTTEKKETTLKIKIDGKMTTQQIAELKLNGKLERELSGQKVVATKASINKTKSESKLVDQQVAQGKEGTKKEKAETSLVCQQTAELKANGKIERELKASQKQAQVGQAELYKIQGTSFKEKTSLDSSKILMDAWAVQAVEGITDVYRLGGFVTETRESDDGTGTMVPNAGYAVVEELTNSAQKLIP